MGKRKRRGSGGTPPRAARRSVKAGGIAIGGSATGAAIGDNARMVQRTTIHYGNGPTVHWPVRVGAVPPLASSFQARSDLRELIDAARDHGEDVVLSQPSASGSVLVGEGGVGKSQLAASYYLRSTADLAVWTTAKGGMGQLVADFADAAFRVGAPGAHGEDDEADARALLDWLRATRRSWLVVIDDVDDLDAVLPWWPHGNRRGWVLATTRRRKALGASRRRVDVDVFTAQEAHAFLHERVPDIPAHAGDCARYEDHAARHPDNAAHLAGDRTDEAAAPGCPAARIAALLGQLPLALSHAASYLLNNRDVTPAGYAAMLQEPGRRLADVLPADGADGYGQAVHTTLLINLDAVEAAEQRPGLARAVLGVLALLDPNGSPAALWTDPTALTALTSPDPTVWQAVFRPGSVLRLTPSYMPGTRRANITRARQLLGTLRDDPMVAFRRHPSLPGLVGADVTQVRDSLLALDRYGLITYQPSGEQTGEQAGEGLVRIHALTARAVRDATLDEQRVAARRAADGLYWLWPEHDYRAPLRPLLQAAAASLLDHAAPHLITLFAGVHALFPRACLSHKQNPQSSAIAFLVQLDATATRILGATHPDAVTVRSFRSSLLAAVGRIDEAVTLGEQVLADRERTLGARHPFTLTARVNLATTYGSAGRVEEAVAIEEEVLADLERTLGAGHEDTLTVRGNLASSYFTLGRVEEAVTIEEEVLADRERIFGPRHPDTLILRGNLAHSYNRVGRVEEAIALAEQVLADRAEVLGPKHPHTLKARSDLCTCYAKVDRLRESVALGRQALADQEEVLGPRHPDTVVTRTNLEMCLRRLAKRGARKG